MELYNADWPLFGWVADVREALFACLEAGRPAVLGTIVALEGGAPQPLGTQMVFDGMRATGYFSGGCIEADVANHAQQVLADGQPRHLTYGKGSPWIDIRLTCGGSLSILLERIAPDDAAVCLLRECYRQRRVAYWSSTGSQRLVRDLRRTDESHAPAYTKTYLPRWRLIVAGENPIALALVALGSQCGLEAILLRPAGTVSAMPIPDARYISGDVIAALQDLAPDRWTAIVAASHDDDLDDAVLQSSLASDAFYVGVLGSVRRSAARQSRMEAVGITSEQFRRIHSPIGLPDCGRSAWEVGVSVIAQLLQSRTALRSSPD